MIYPKAGGNQIEGSLEPGDEVIGVSGFVSPSSVSFSSSYTYNENPTSSRGGPKVLPSVAGFVDSLLRLLRGRPAPKPVAPAAPAPPTAPAVPAYVPVPAPAPASVPMPVSVPVPQYTPPPAPAVPQYYYNPQPAPAPVPVQMYAPQCPSGHVLTFSGFAYPDGYYNCDVCKNPGACAQGRWFCQFCSYDMCPNCRPPPEEAKSAVEAKAPVSIHKCEAGHDLEFSRFLYQCGRYICNRCRGTGVCSLGRWFCTGCSYDICPACRPAPAPKPGCAMGATCDAGHPLKFSFAPYQCGQYRCNVCRQGGYCCLGRWFCSTCSYDMCQNCKAAPDLRCPNKHQLRYQTSAAGIMSYACPFCMKTYTCHQGVLACEACMFYMCPDCVPSLSDTSRLTAALSGMMKATETEPLFCAAGHLMFYSYFYAPCCASYSCGKCSQTRATSDGRWLCFSCNANVCGGCHAPPKVSAADVTLHYLCPQGHMLFFTTYLPQGLTYSCPTCGKTKSCTGGVLSCSRCRYVKCPQCVPIQYTPGSSKLDPQGHPMMRLRVEGEQAREYYRCSRCGKCRMRGEAHHVCAFCNHNVCQSCLPS